MVMFFFALYIILNLLLLILLIPVTTLLHELGHAIPLMLMTRRGATVFVGSYGEEEKCLRLKIGGSVFWLGYRPKYWFRGCCLLSYERISQLQLFIIILCGPVFTIAVALVCSYLAFRFDMHALLKLVCILTVPWGIIDLFLNLRSSVVRLKNGKVHYSDGYILYHLKKHYAYFHSLTNAGKWFNEKDYARAANEYTNIITRGYDSGTIYRAAIHSFLLAKDYGSAYPLQLAFEKKYTQTADDYYHTGLSCLFLNKEERWDYYQKALAIDENHSYSLNAAGYCLNMQRRFTEALPLLDKAIRVNPQLSYAYNNRGHAKIELGEQEAGLQDINYSLTLDNTNSYAYRNLGIYHLYEGNKAMALSFFEKAKALDETTDMIEELIEKTR